MTQKLKPTILKMRRNKTGRYIKASHELKEDWQGKARGSKYTLPLLILWVIAVVGLLILSVRVK